VTPNAKTDIWNREIWGSFAACCGILFFVSALFIPVLSFTKGTVDPKGPAGFVSLIGMPSFILGHVFGIIALASDKARSKKLARWSLFGIWMTMVTGVVLILIFRDR
jgi:hypothetical protein